MRKPVLLFVVLAITLTAHAVSNDAGAVLAQARQHIEKRQFSEAAVLLEQALVSAAAITDPALREKATTAIRFYAGVAYSGLGDDAKATPHVQHYLDATPNARVDPAKYDARFVALFNRLGGGSKEKDEPAAFDTLYPSFRTFFHSPAPRPAGTWGSSPAMELLATREEKRQWHSLVSESDREAFITDFWQKRDSNPATPENEYQAAFDRRVAFADQVFGTRAIRGASDDRGRVFILLGEPSFVRRRPISHHDKVQLAYRATMVTGTIEQWVYTREQLPVRINKPQVAYRFVNQIGIGDHVLQRQEDAFAMQALAEAGAPRATGTNSKR